MKGDTQSGIMGALILGRIAEAHGWSTDRVQDELMRLRGKTLWMMTWNDLDAVCDVIQGADSQGMVANETPMVAHGDIVASEISSERYE